jgi:hypothetical protein
LAYRGAPSPTPQERILTSLATKKRPPTSRCQWKHGDRPCLTGASSRVDLGTADDLAEADLLEMPCRPGTSRKRCYGKRGYDMLPCLIAVDTVIDVKKEAGDAVLIADMMMLERGATLKPARWRAPLTGYGA